MESVVELVVVVGGGGGVDDEWWVLLSGSCSPPLTVACWLRVFALMP